MDDEVQPSNRCQGSTTIHHYIWQKKLRCCQPCQRHRAPLPLEECLMRWQRGSKPLLKSWLEISAVKHAPMKSLVHSCIDLTSIYWATIPNLKFMRLDVFQNSDFRMVIYHIVCKMGSRAVLGDKHINISVEKYIYI